MWRTPNYWVRAVWCTKLSLWGGGLRKGWTTLGFTYVQPYLVHEVVSAAWTWWVLLPLHRLSLPSEVWEKEEKIVNHREGRMYSRIAQLSCLFLNPVVRFELAHCTRVSKSIYTFYPELPINFGPIGGNQWQIQDFKIVGADLPLM